MTAQIIEVKYENGGVANGGATSVQIAASDNLKCRIVTPEESTTDGIRNEIRKAAQGVGFGSASPAVGIGERVTNRSQ